METTLDDPLLTSALKLAPLHSPSYISYNMKKTPSVTNAKSWMWERLKDIAADSENVQH